MSKYQSLSGPDPEEVEQQSIFTAPAVGKYSALPSPETDPPADEVETDISRAIRLAPPGSPEQVATDLAISQQAGVPSSLVHRNRDEFVTKQEQGRLFEATKNRPAFAEFLRDPANVSLVRQDIEGATALEDLMNGRNALEPVVGGSSGTDPVAASVAGHPDDPLNQPLSGTAKGLAKGAARVLPTITEMSFEILGGAAGGLHEASKMVDAVTPDWLLGKSGGYFGQLRDDSQAVASWIRDNVTDSDLLGLPDDKKQALIDKPELLLDPEWLLVNTADAASSLGVMWGAAVATGGNSEVGAVLGGAMEGANLYHELLDQGVDETNAYYGSVAFGYVVSRLEKIGLTKILGKERVKSVAQRLTKSLVVGGIEGVTEYLEEPAQAFFGAMAKGEGFFPSLDAAIHAFRNIDVIVPAMLTGGGLAHQTTYKREQAMSQAAEQNLEFFKQLNQGIKASALKKTAPDRFKGYAALLAEHSAAPKSIFIPAARLEEALGGEQELQVFLAKTGTSEQLDQARVTDGDIEIPLPEFLAHLAGTDQAVALEQDFRFTAEQMTAREAAAWRDDYLTLFGKDLDAAKEAADRLAEEDNDRGEVMGAINAALTAVGLDSEQAEANASIWAARAQVAAQGYTAAGQKMTPLQWLGTHGLVVRNEATGAEFNMSRTSVPQDGQGMVFSQPANRDEVQKIAASVAPGIEYQGQEQSDAGLHQFIDTATGRNFSVANPTAEEIKSAKDKMDAAWAEYEQAAAKKVTDSPEFKKWFGDSVVTVDGKAGGEPLVVYHGSDRELSVIQPGYREPGAWFTTSFRNASSYSKGIEGTVHSVYLNAKNPLVVSFSGTDVQNGYIEVNGEDFEDNVEIVKYAKKQGFDSVNFTHGNFSEDDTTWVVFSPTQIKSIFNKGAFDPANPDILYQAAAKDDQSKNLYVAHNLDERKLRHVIDLGGMAAPSLAVANADLSPFDSFGDITLLAGPDLLESAKAHVFDADVYSPRYPQATYVIDDGKLNTVLRWIKDDRHKLRFPDYSTLESDGDRGFIYNDAFRYAWLRDNGMAPRILKKQSFYLHSEIAKKFRSKKTEQAFQLFAAEKFNEVVKDKKIFKGFTYSGRRKYIPYTLDNILKEMTASLRGGEGFNYGAGNIRAAFAKKFKGVKDVQKSRGKLTTDEEMKRLKEESQEKLTQLLDYLRPFYKFSADSFGYLDDASSAIAEGSKGLREAFDLDSEARGKINSFVQYLVNLPTEYFEAKIQRVVQLQEFDAAVVPKGASEYVVDKLKRRGIDVKFYKKGDNADRLRVVRSTATLFQSSVGQQNRGSVEFRQNETIIRLFKTADAATFLHETGHIFLEDLKRLSTLASAPEAVKADWAAVKSFVGAETDDLTREQHEKFARSFELYLREGKAPSLELTGVFRRFKRWLTKVYQFATQLDVELNDEMRAVFGRMLAAEEAISEATEYQRVAPLYASAEEAGMTPEEYEMYVRANSDIIDKAREQLLAALMKDIAKKNRRWYRDERRRFRAELTKELQQQPDYRALHFIQNGFLPGEEAPADARRMPLDIDKIREMGFDPKQLVRSVPPIYGKGGEHPDILADALGFSSGEALLNDLTGLPTLKTAVEARVGEYMNENFADLVSADYVQQEARAALDNENRVDLLALEQELALRRLHKAENQQAFAERARQAAARGKIIRKAAQAAIGALKVPLATQVSTHLQAERRAAKKAQEAAAAGNAEKLVKAKHEQLMAAALASESNKARAEVDRIHYYLSKFKRPGTRKKIDVEYLEQIDHIMELFDLRRATSQKAIKRRDSLTTWIAQQRARGFEPNIPADIELRASTISYKELTLDEFRAMRDAVRSVETLGRFKHKLLTARNKLTLEANVEELVQQAEDTYGGKIGPEAATREDRSLGKKLGHLAKTIEAELTKVEFMCQILDNGKLNGKWWEMIYRPVNDGANAKAARFLQIRDYLYGADMFGRYTKKELREMSTKKVHVPEVRASFTREQLLAVALNRGNKENWTALLEGEGWTDTEAAAVLAKLDERDWDVVQHSWDFVNSFWPEIERLYKRLSGTPPAKVQAEPFQTPAGRDMAGGYYPLVADTELSIRASQREEAKSVQEMFGGNAFRPSTRNGHTIERRGFGGQRVSLRLDVLVRHLDQVTHDIYLREAVIDVDRLLQHERISQVVRRTLGREQYDQLRPWLAAVAGQKAYDFDGWAAVSRFFRRNATMAMMGFKATVFVSQYVGLLNVVPLLTQNTSLNAVSAQAKLVRNLGRALGASHSKVGKFVGENSIELKDRRHNFIQEVTDLSNNFGFGKHVKKWQEFLMYFTALADYHVCSAAWYTTYQQALADGKTEQQAKDLSDAVVRMSQGSGKAKDLSRMQNSSEHVRAFMLFYSYMNTNLNQLMASAKNFGTGKRKAKLLGEAFFYWFAPAILAELAAGRGPDDDKDEPWAKWAAERLLLEHPAGLLPGVRDMYAAAFGEYGAPTSPVVRAATSLGKTFDEALDDDGDDADLFWKAVETAGYFVPFPSSQARITGRQVYEYLNGDRDDFSPLYYSPAR